MLVRWFIDRASLFYDMDRRNFRDFLPRYTGLGQPGRAANAGLSVASVTEPSN